MTTIHRRITALLAPVLQLGPANRLKQIIHWALSHGAALLRVAVRERIIIQVEIGIALPDDVVEPENEVHVIQLDEAPEPPEPPVDQADLPVAQDPEPPEDEMGTPANQDMVPGAAEAHAALMRSLYGILRHPTP